VRRWISPGAVVWISIGAVYFLIPLIATLLFSLRKQDTGKCCTLANYGEILHDPAFRTSMRISAIVALETVVISMVLLVPTVYWVNLKLRRLRPVISFLALVPFVVPPIVLVVGLFAFYQDSPDWFYAEPYGFLPAAYVILAFPYMYFALDAGFRAIDIHTLTEASQSLGAGWWTTITRVILPNIRTAVIAGALLTIAIVLGEFTIASLAVFDTFPTYVQYINQNKTYPAGAVTLLAFMLTWGAMVTVALGGRRRTSTMVGR
jgi:putative spermidine/putrescine transport system permease protein